jgi:hypothetical protein
LLLVDGMLLDTAPPERLRLTINSAWNVAFAAIAVPFMIVAVPSQSRRLRGTVTVLAAWKVSDGSVMALP